MPRSPPRCRATSCCRVPTAPPPAITIAARPEEVWPWLAQMGQGRGGLYSYDVLEARPPPTRTEAMSGHVGVAYS